MPVINPIFPGFAWAQAFDLPTDFVLAGDAFRAEVRGNVEDPAPKVSVSSSGSGIEIDNDRLYLRLTEDQTAGLPFGTVITGFVLIRASVEIPLGQIVRIPVTRYPTRPAA